MPTKIKNYYEPEELRQIEKLAEGKIDHIIQTLGITGLRRKERFYDGVCPIHGGDKKNAFNIFHSGDEVEGNWRCFTMGCHKIFQPSIIGFVRAFLSKTRYGWENRTSTMAPFTESIEFFLKLVDGKIGELDLGEVEKQRFVRQVKQLYQDNTPESTLKFPKDRIKELLKVPSSYYLARGYTKEVLEKYYVGNCEHNTKEMSGRAIVPIFDNDFENMIGCTGRSIYPQCTECKAHHSPIQKCPHEDYAWQFSKWRHNKGLKTERYLYSFFAAQSFIRESKVVIITESPGNVWRLDESGIYNSVACFGAHFTDHQKKIIDNSGAMAICIIPDNDAAGREMKKQILKMCENSYKIVSIDLNSNDVGDMSIEQVKNRISPVIQKLECQFK